jgi:hypothetical protein
VRDAGRQERRNDDRLWGVDWFAYDDTLGRRATRPAVLSAAPQIVRRRVVDGHAERASGMLGLSGVSSGMRALQDSADPLAVAAVSSMR